MGINFLAVLLCGVVAMIVGMVWYSKMLFGNAFMRAIGSNPNMLPEEMRAIQKKMWQLHLTQFVLVLFQVWVLSLFVKGLPETPIIALSLLIWAGFVMVTTAGNAMWSARPRKMAWHMFLISSGYQLVLFVLFGLILKSWM